MDFGRPKGDAARSDARSMTQGKGDEAGRPSFPVVGIGASAGGLDAFLEFLEALPPAPGAAFVLIPHLDPNHPSLMPQILARSSKVPVLEIDEGLRLEPDRAYILRPNAIATLAGDRFHVRPRSEGDWKAQSIDCFFTSLADVCRDRAVGVILSGMASDGTAGLRAIKAEGGVTFAQDDSARYPQMPGNAVAAGVVDTVLPPRTIAAEIVRMARHPYLTPAEKAPPLEGEEAMSAVLALLLKVTGVDFADYKPNTIRRRVLRRMALRGAEALREYYEFLKENPDEVRTLHDELLINVTSFFREPWAFDALRERVFPLFLEGRSPRDPVRIWVAGCSTGEEAFSLAMALTEFFEERGVRFDLQVFATDISERAIERARAGIYPPAIEADVSPPRLRRFFEKTDRGEYRVSKSIRDLCVFARHDLTRDPPFSRIDLLSCRNVLIYLGSALQRKVIPMFHYALKPHGFLLLGSSETIGPAEDLFTCVDPKARLYLRIPTTARPPVHFSTEGLHPPERAGAPAPARSGSPEFSLRARIDQALLTACAPPLVVVDDEDRVVEFRGDTSPFLRQAPDQPSFSLLKMVREDLTVHLDQALREARREGRPARRERLRLEDERGAREASIEVLPLPGEGRTGYSIVLFREVPAARAPTAGAGVSGAASGEGGTVEAEVERLRRDLATTRESQQGMIERLEAANQELRSAHEEALSSNEELQSMNEELQTAKEELQSSNEELNTLNDELRSRNLELGQANSDLTNVISSLNIPLAIVDPSLRLRRFSPQAEKLFNVIPADMNRRITDFKPRIDVPDLEKLLLGVLETLSSVEREVRDEDGRWYLLRVRPYRSVENRIEGAVIVLLDIDALKRTSLEAEEGRSFTQAIIEAMRDPLLVLGSDFRVLLANRAYYEFFGTRPDEILARGLCEIQNRQWDLPPLKRLLGQVVAEEGTVRQLEVATAFGPIGPRTLVLSARRMRFRNGGTPRILLTLEDVTERRKAEEEIARMNTALESRVRERTAQLEGARGEMEAFSYSVAHDLRAPLRAMHGFAYALLEDYADRPLDEEGREYLRRIMESSGRMDALIQDLLAYSRLAREEIPLQPLEPLALLREVLAEMSPELESRGAQVEVDEGCPAVQAHGVTLKQVLTNLLSNAVKFVAPGVRSRVRVYAEATDRKVRLFVEDNGIGIERKYLDRIFRVFERIHRSEEYAGTGVGLAIVRRAVERMGGSVGVESEPGKGSRFWIELDRAGEAS